MRRAYEIGTALFLVIAVYFLYSGFTVTTHIPQPHDGDAIANLELMHIQSLNFMTGIGSAIVAAVLSLGMRP